MCKRQEWFFKLSASRVGWERRTQAGGLRGLSQGWYYPEQSRAIRTTPRHLKSSAPQILPPRISYCQTVRTRSLNPKLADTFCALIMPPENFDFARRLNYRCGELKSFTADEEPRLLSFVQFLTRKSRRSSPRVQIVNSQVAF